MSYLERVISWENYSQIFSISIIIIIYIKLDLNSNGQNMLYFCINLLTFIEGFRLGFKLGHILTKVHVYR